MKELKKIWHGKVTEALNKLRISMNVDCPGITEEEVLLENPPDPGMGDLGFPMFMFAKKFRKGPPVIAREVAEILSGDVELAEYGRVQSQGPYVNVFVSREKATESVLKNILLSPESYGKTNSLSGRKIMIEFSSPNTNKPLHLGHLRNDALGESVSRILKFLGAEVYKVCIINNRGVHICKSMLAYKKFGNNETPESLGVKSDRFVGDFYVKFAKWASEDPGAEEEAQKMLRKWEAGDPDTVALWKKMNNWAVSGMERTYKRTGVSFDKYYFESDTYLLGKDAIAKGLEEKIFYKDEEGTTWVDLTEENLDKKVLLRKDGTSVYITQDIGTAIQRHNDWPFDQLVYVVGSEQIYHFKVLFLVLKKLGYSWADMLYHLSYGMVNLPEGRMKSREGTVVDADDLIDSLRDMAVEEIKVKNREEAVGDINDVAEKIALGALHYFLLQVTPSKDMLFNPKESLSFNGDTGPYLQYMGARITSVLKKAEASPSVQGAVSDYSLLDEEYEWELLKLLAKFPDVVDEAGRNMDPSRIALYLYELSKGFSRFYHECPILDEKNPVLSKTRLDLAKAVLVVLKNAMNLVMIPFLESM